MGMVVRECKWKVGCIGVIAAVYSSGALSPCVAIVPGELHLEGCRVRKLSIHLNDFTRRLKVGDILPSGWVVASCLSIIILKSPPRHPEDCELRRRFGMVSAQNDSTCSINDDQ
jgi:hypothetical protein